MCVSEGKQHARAHRRCYGLLRRVRIVKENSRRIVTKFTRNMDDVASAAWPLIKLYRVTVDYTFGRKCT